MEQKEILELLQKMDALEGVEERYVIDSYALMQDPIVANRLAVEVLQRIDRELKPELVIAPEGVGSYFGYSIALAAWMRFSYASFEPAGAMLPANVQVKAGEKTLICFDCLDVEKAESLVELVKLCKAKPLGILCLSSSGVDSISGVPVVSLL